MRRSRESIREVPDDLTALVGGAVIGDDHLPATRPALAGERLELPPDRVGAVQARDDDAERRCAHHAMDVGAEKVVMPLGSRRC